MKNSLVIFFLILSTTAGFTQRGILFRNKNTQQEILIKEGDLVKFTYNGYIGQKEAKLGVVMSIQDTMVEVVAPVSGRLSGGTETRFIYTKDITGFRKFHRSRPYLMLLSNVAITAGSIYLYYVINKNTNLSFGEKLGISLGTGLVSSFIVRGFFPEKVKNKIGEEWEMKVLK